MMGDAAIGPTTAIRPSALFRPTRTEINACARPQDGLVVFSVMWGMAMLFSVASHPSTLDGDHGLVLAALNWAVLGTATILIMNPGRTRLLGVVALLMITQYVWRLPVSSNNQTIALFMNVAILAVIVSEIVRSRGLARDRDLAFERLRVVARALLATMYFYGVFHKINSDFLDPRVSCATALYVPLTAPFGLDQNLFGIYGAITATFVIETIAIVCLYWRRFFWVGLVLSLPFHFMIPISGYSWYMDFSSLVFALYMLSVPREVAAGLYSTGVSLVRRTPWLRAGPSAVMALALVFALAAAAVLAASTTLFPGRSLGLLWHSIWLVIWTLFAGVAMVLITRAAVLALPYRDEPARARQPWWIYAIPTVLFVSCLSPYLGLKTESSIAMFSNLHTEGGQSNHLLLPQPPYLFGYQERVARIVDSSSPKLRDMANANLALVEHDIAIRLSADPDLWISYVVDGKRYEKVTAATFDGRWPNLLERKLLDFKPVDFTRPKVCTH